MSQDILCPLLSHPHLDRCCGSLGLLSDWRALLVSLSASAPCLFLNVSLHGFGTSFFLLPVSLTLCYDGDSQRLWRYHSILPCTSLSPWFWCEENSFQTGRTWNSSQYCRDVIALRVLCHSPPPLLSTFLLLIQLRGLFVLNSLKTVCSNTRGPGCLILSFPEFLII